MKQANHQLSKDRDANKESKSWTKYIVLFLIDGNQKEESEEIHSPVLLVLVAEMRSLQHQTQLTPLYW